MAIIHNDKISTSFKYVKIGPNVELSLEGVEHEYSVGTKASVTSESDISSKRKHEERRKIRRSEGCFITKQPGFSLENAHWINAVRKDPTRKSKVEKFLYELSVVADEFKLDDVSNLAPLDRSLHYTLDKLGFFAVTCTKDTLQAMIALVEAENNAWQATEGEFRRKFNFKQPPFTDAKYELVVLHPRHFLPKIGNALTVFTEVGNALSGKLYSVGPDGALRERDSTQDLLPPFTSNRRRASDDLLNPFLVILNAHIAFRRCKPELRSTLCQHYNDLIDLTIELANKIYFKPLIDHTKQEHGKIRHSNLGDASSDVEMEEAGPVDELGRSKVDNDKTITQRAIGRRSGRMRAVVNGLNLDASSDIEDNHEDAFPSLDVPPHSLGQVDIIEKVEQWLIAAH